MMAPEMGPFFCPPMAPTGEHARHPFDLQTDARRLIPDVRQPGLTSYYPRNRELVKLVCLLMKTFLRGLALGLVLPLCCTPWSAPIAWSANRAPGRASDKKSGEKKAGEIKASDVLLST